jgi:hypothetical protein
MANGWWPYGHWYPEGATPQHEARWTIACTFHQGSGWQTWWCYAYPPWSPKYGWTYFYNPNQGYFPWRCRNHYNPQYDPNGYNWCFFQAGGWTDPGPGPSNFPQSPDQVPDPPDPPPGSPTNVPPSPP